MKRSKTSEESTIRAEVAKELYNKKQCTFETYECTQLAIDGFSYCTKHILNDKNAPYKQCAYVYHSNGKKCNLPAAKNDKKELNFCNEHTLKSNLATNRKNSKCPPLITPEAILNTLGHHVKNLKESHGKMLDVKVTKSIDPLVDLDANAIINAQSIEVLNWASESESDTEPSTYSTVWHDVNLDSSDNESIDSEEEDALKHANVYTSEEISLITRDKLARLQSLYIEQYRHLQYLLKEKRRKYLHALRREKETCCSIYNQVHDNPKEQRLYGKLKQYKKYHKTCGTEAILAKTLRDLRAKATEGTPSNTSKTNFQKCCFTEGGVKCGERALPMAKHCRKHILEDTTQVLFKACGKMIGDIECNTPVEAIFDDSPCQLHMEIPLIRAYDRPRKDSDSDTDDNIELPPGFAMPNSDNVKTELMDYSSMQQDIPKTLPTQLFEDSKFNFFQNSSEKSTDGMFDNTSQDNENLDVTGSDTMDIDVTDTSVKKDPTKNNQNSQDSIQEKTIENETSSFLSSLCVLDDSKLEELDKKWNDMKKSTPKKAKEGDSNNKNNIKAKNEEKTKAVGGEPNKPGSSSAGEKLNESDHESYSRPASEEAREGAEGRE